MPPGTDYAVGFGKPPQHTRFKKGQSGNPQGRPKGSKNTLTLFEQELDKKISVVVNGRRRMISKREAMVAQTVNKAIAADPRATKLIIELMRDADARREQEQDDVAHAPQSLNAIEKAIADRFVARKTRELGHDDDRP